MEKAAFQMEGAAGDTRETACTGSEATITIPYRKGDLMDANLVTSAVTALAPVLPYLLDKAGDKAADEAVKKVGKGAWDYAKAIWFRLWPKIQAKEAAQEAADDVVRNPDDEDALAALRLQLKKLLTEDEGLAAEIARLLDEGRKAGVVVTASGDRALAIGRDATGATIIIGDQNKLGRK
jgi:hypothetical protein